VDDCLFESGGDIASRHGMASRGQLRGVTISSGKVHASSAVVCQTSSTHPDTASRSCAWLKASLCSKRFYDSTRRPVETDDSSSVVVLNTVRCPSGIDDLTNLEQRWSLVLVTSN
jgi:hypothetical protein